MRTLGRWSALMLLACGAAVTAAGAEDAGARSRWNAANRPDEEVVRWVKLSDIPILKSILHASPNYTISEDVEVDGYYYRFFIHTPHGDYEVTSVRKLIKRCHEIDVFEHFRTSEQGNLILQGVGQSFVGVGKGLGAVVRHPGVAAKRVGAGAGRSLRATGGFFSRPFRKSKPALASDGTDRASLGKGPAGGERRRLAHELGLDAYSENENVKTLLNSMARRRLFGKLPIGAAVFALPGGAAFTLSLTPMGYDASTEELIRDNGPTELKRALGLRYAQQFRLDYPKEGAPLMRLLDNPNYTPREQAYLWRYLTDLQGLEGIEDALSFLASVQTHEWASVVSTQVEMLSLLHHRGKPLRRFAILSTGDLDHKSVAFARSKGVLVFHNILENKVFQRPRHEGDPTLWSGVASGGKSTLRASAAARLVRPAPPASPAPEPDAPDLEPAAEPSPTSAPSAKGVGASPAIPELEELPEIMQ